MSSWNTHHQPRSLWKEGLHQPLLPALGSPHSRSVAQVDVCAGSHISGPQAQAPGAGSGPGRQPGWAELRRPGLGAVGHSLGLSIWGMRAQFLRTLALNGRTQAGTPSAQEAGGLTPTRMTPEPAEHHSEKCGLHSSTSYRYGSPKPLRGPHPFLSPVTAAFPVMFSDFCPLWR